MTWARGTDFQPGGLGWLEVECNRCKNRARLPLDAIRRPRDTPIWKLEAAGRGKLRRPPHFSLPSNSLAC
jgi:hypothetical protein